jgi:hypothetical protein
MNQLFFSIQKHFENVYNWAIHFLNELPNTINKLKAFCTYIITLVKLHFNNLLELKNINFDFFNIWSSLGIVGNAIIALLFFVIFLIVVCFFTSILDMIKKIFKIIKLIIWHIPFKMLKKIIILIIKILKLLFLYKKNKITETKIEEKIIVKNEEPKETIFVQNDLFNLHETIKKQNSLLEKIIQLNLSKKTTTKNKKKIIKDKKNNEK